MAPRRLPALPALARLAGFVVAINAVGAAPSLVSSPDTPWFRSLEKPAVYPPEIALWFVWTILFPLLGIALWALIVATVVAFRRVDRRAAVLLAPYLAWVTFAAILNYELWRLN